METINFQTGSMIKHYLIITWRNLLRKKNISLINLFGLVTGITSFILIFLWVNNELSYDTFHKNLDNIYRIYFKEKSSTGTNFQLAVQAPLANALKEKYPEIKNASRFFIHSKILVKHDERAFWESKLAFADPSFFNIFTFPFIKGNPETALTNIHSIVLTKKTAEKYFPDTDPIGKIITIQNYPLMVTGVLKYIPENSSLQFDFIVPFDFLAELWDWPEMNQSWYSWTFYTYLLVNKNADIDQFKKELAPFYSERLNLKEYELCIQPFKETYLNPVEIAEIYNQSSSKKHIYIFSFVALLILIITTINFINLFTVNSFCRAKEVGVKKSFGVKKVSLIVQYLFEAILIVLIALNFAVIFVKILLPGFNSFTGKEITLGLYNYRFVIGLIAGLILTGIIAGLYPAFYMSAFKPVKVLKGSLFRIEKKLSLRKLLIVFQFIITIILLIATIVAYKQMSYIKNRGLGFSGDHVLYLSISDNKKYSQLKSELLKIPLIQSVTAADYFSAESVSNTDGFNFEGKPDDMNFNLTIQQVDFDFLKTLDVKIVDGRDFSQEIKTDATSAYILNEKAVKLMGINNPVGKTFYLWGNKGTIIGIAGNANFLSLKQDLDPRLYMIKLPDVNFEYVLIKLNSKSLQGGNSSVTDALSGIKKVWKEVYPDTPFEFRFVNQLYDRVYRTDRQNNLMFGIFSLLAIIISCLGLLGLTLLTTEQKTKEIGIRKVNGATNINIMVMLNLGFIKLIAIAFIISVPIAYYIMNKWLQNFAYYTDISWWIFISAGIIAVLIAFITVSYQSWKISNTNPVEKLKYE
jgi:putative ABC transport system permease protein